MICGIYQQTLSKTPPENFRFYNNKEKSKFPFITAYHFFSKAPKLPLMGPKTLLTLSKLPLILMAIQILLMAIQVLVMAFQVPFMVIKGPSKNSNLLLLKAFFFLQKQQFAVFPSSINFEAHFCALRVKEFFLCKMEGYGHLWELFIKSL